MAEIQNHKLSVLAHKVKSMLSIRKSQSVAMLSSFLT